MGSCKNKRLIGPFLDGQLGECQWLEDHIAECSECLHEYEAVQHLSYLAQKADYPPPESSYWKKFGIRVIARIAARPQPKKYTKIFDAIFANRLAVRLVTPLLAVLIVVLAIKLYSPLNTARVAYSDLNHSTPADNISLNQVVHRPVFDIQSGALANQPDLPPTIQADNSSPTKLASIAEIKSHEEITANTNNGLAPANSAIEEPEEIAAADIDHLVKGFLSQNPLKTSQRKNYGLSRSSWREMALDLKMKAFNTDEIIKFQILSGSNPSLAPLSSYREATEKFFAPRISTSRPLFDQNTPNLWGYAVGDDNYNEDRLRHLELELDLIREK